MLPADLTTVAADQAAIQADLKNLFPGKVGGSGGGRPDLAEAGGKDTSGIETALSTVYPLIDRLL